MKIIIDCEYGPDGIPVGFQYVETANQDVISSLTAMQANKAALQAGGWNEQTKLPGHADGVTRWQVLVASAKKAQAPKELTALNLSE